MGNRNRLDEKLLSFPVALAITAGLALGTGAPAFADTLELTSEPVGTPTEQVGTTGNTGGMAPDMQTTNTGLVAQSDGDVSPFGEYGLMIAGVAVTQENMGGAGWSYTPATETSAAILILNGAHLTHAENVIETDRDLIINVIADSTIENLDNDAGRDAINQTRDHSLTITGGGTLTVKGGYNQQDPYPVAYGIYASSLTVDGTVVAQGAPGISCADLTVNGSLTATGKDVGISADSVIINKGASLVATATGSSGKALDARTRGGNLTLKNAEAGTGWTNVEATEGRATIEPSAEGQPVSTKFKHAQFPAVPNATVTTAPLPVILSYNGGNQALATAGKATDGTMQYALGTDGTTAPTTGWSETVPTGKEIGKYYVWYRVIGDAKHSDVQPACVESDIVDTLVVKLRGHVQNVGDVSARTSGKGVVVGTEGQSLRLESFSTSLPSGTDGGIEYRGHIQDKGWESWFANGRWCGTIGQSKRVEAVQMRLTGEVAKTHSVWYRVHSQNYGWLSWARDGQAAGTAGQSLRIESLEVCVLPKDQTPTDANTSKASFVGAVSGRTHVQNVGWSAISGTSLGTTGRGLRMEALALNAPSLPESCGITYEAHVQDIGWQGERENGKVAGTERQSKRIEAVRISLTGEAAKSYSVWYRVHSQDYGWLGWTHDGKDAGTEGLAKRAESMEVQILPEGQYPNGYDSSQRAFVTA